MLADVDAGSNTPSLVGLVLKWRKEKASEGCLISLLKHIVADKHHAFPADQLWTTLDKLNQSLAQTFSGLSSLYEQDPETYTIVVKYISSLRVEQVSLSNL
jgi:phosphomevalonate kinase